MPAFPALRASRVRVYETVRTAHLERAHQLDPAAIVYRQQRYDFDDSLTTGLELHHTSARGAVRLLLAPGVREVEINEPVSTGVVFTAAALLGLAARRLLGRGRATVTTYAIANLDPRTGPRSAHPKAVVRFAVYRLLSAFIWHRLDRIVYGTDAARELYHRGFPARDDLEETTIAALPVARDVGDDAKKPGTVVFLGALAERKGFPLVLAAWPAVRTRVPGAMLTIVGKGDLIDQAKEAAAADPSIELVVDPARPTIFSLLDAAQTLVLPSQARPSWREQVGLPIVEGLSSGCSIVTTGETGLADWLIEHGHAVLPADTDAEALADAICRALERRRPASAVLHDLPPVDGRLAADRWLFRAAP